MQIRFACLIVLLCLAPPGFSQATITGSPPIEVTSGNIAFGFHFRSTISASTYTVTQEDCGYILRFNNPGSTAVTLPLLKFPCVLMFFSDNAGVTTVTLPAGDFNGAKAFTLHSQEGAILSVSSGGKFYRGLATGGIVGGGGSRTSIPPHSHSDLPAALAVLALAVAIFSAWMVLKPRPG